MCNFDGDSVSVVSLQLAGSAVNATLMRTGFMGDEPADIAFNAASTIAMVTLSSHSQVTFVDPTSLAQFGAPWRLDATFANIPNGIPLAVKAPRSAAWLPNDRLLVLNLMGNQRPANPPGAFYDVDLWRIDTPFTPGTSVILGDIGTTNHAFRLNSSGTQMFVVGTRAQNEVRIGPNVATSPTGFVQSWLTVVNIPTSGPMSVQPEGAPASPGGSFPSINLNRDYTIPGTGTLNELPAALGISQPTDVALLESGGSVVSIALTGFHSDNVAILTPSPSTPGGYVLNRQSLTPRATYTVVGPRGVAFNAAGTLLFTNGRLDNSLTAIDTTSPTLASTTVSLRQDPTPQEIRTGRQFLYSTLFSRRPSAPPGETRGFVSCASCHVDGRTDGLLWDLSAPPTNTAINVAGNLNDSANVFPFPFSQFPVQKGVMMTQTLQGLINYPISEAFLFLATNSPYHWRGDKPGFVNFNEAFVNLQLMPNQPGAGTQENAMGLTAGDMVNYRRFINTIRHPSNPEESIDRTVTGQLPANPNQSNPALANGFSGSLMGRTLFLNVPTVGIRSCGECHSLPEASSNTFTDSFPTGKVQNEINPIETAALRNVFAREGQIHTGTTASISGTSIVFPGSAFVSNRGLTHNGNDIMSINTFIGSPAFFAALPGQTNQEKLDQISALVKYVREFDTGMAPLSGFAFTLTNGIGDTGINKQGFDFLEPQVGDANIGLGVQVNNGAVVTFGFFFDPTIGLYVDAANPLNPPISRASLITTYAAGSNVVVAQGTPLGTDRRWANPVGAAVVIGGIAPQLLTLENMAPDTFFKGITNLNLNIPTSPSLGTTRWRLNQFQGALQGSFNIPTGLRHEPPRRFRVSGTNIRAGATLFLQMTDGSSPSSFLLPAIEMKLYPTRYTGAGNRPIWETEVELDQLQTFVLLCGGPFAPSVQQILVQDTVNIPAFPTFDLRYNQYKAIVVNEDGTATNLNPLPSVLSVQDTR